MGKICLQLPETFALEFGFFLLCHIDNCSDKFDKVSGLIEYRMRIGTDILQCPIGQHNPEFLFRSGGAHRTLQLVHECLKSR